VKGHEPIRRLLLTVQVTYETFGPNLQKDSEQHAGSIFTSEEDVEREADERLWASK